MSKLTMATSLEEARAAAADSVAEYRAGATDLVDRRRHGITRGDVVDILQMPDLDHIQRLEDGRITIGAHVRLADIAGSDLLYNGYPGLTQSAGGLATPQIRAMATLGGSLLQRTRCWYFRHDDFSCYKKGGDGCPAREGDHRHGVIFDRGPCVFPHPSTMGMTLLAYQAEVEVNGEAYRPVADLYGDGSDPTRDHLLEPGDVLTAVRLPEPVPDERAAYFRSISRARAEWPLVECVARLVIEDETIIFARLAVGGVAPVPLRLSRVEAVLEGQPATDETFEKAGIAATEGASPLRQTGYKVPLLTGTVRETLRRAREA